MVPRKREEKTIDQDQVHNQNQINTNNYNNNKVKDPQKGDYIGFICHCGSDHPFSS